MLNLLRRYRQGFLGFPSVVQSIFDHASMNSGKPGPLSASFRNSVQRDSSIVALVSDLNFRRGPNTVSELIVSFIIQSLNRMLTTWPRPHVAQELFKALSPFVTNRNAATSVARVGVLVRIQTPTLDSGPSLILGAACLAVSFLVHAELNKQTAATLTGSIFEISTPNALLRSAVAAAQPIPRPEIGQSRPSVEFSASDINRLAWHDFKYITMKKAVQS